jgi:hypothetical protein
MVIVAIGLMAISGYIINGHCWLAILLITIEGYSINGYC